MIYNYSLDIFFGLFIFLLGICLGSFANVLIYRLKNVEQGKRKIVQSRSFCPHCKHKLGALDLIPLFSYLFLLGKCRYCRRKISWQYPLVEFAMGILFLLVFLWSGLSFGDLMLFKLGKLPRLLLGFFVCFVVVVITTYDILYMEIPDEVMLPSIVFLFILSIARSVCSKFDINCVMIDFIYMPSFSNAFIGFLIPVLFFIFQILLSGGAWIGGGDLRIGAFMGLLLGWQKTLAALALGYSVGAIFGLILIAIYKRRNKQAVKKSLKLRIPFGPFLGLGTLVSYLYGDWLVYAYVKFLFDY